MQVCQIEALRVSCLSTVSAVNIIHLLSYIDTGYPWNARPTVKMKGKNEGERIAAQH